MSTVHPFRVSLKPRIYRAIEIRSTASLYDLGEAIVKAFDFSFDHAFGFFGNGTDNIWRSTVRYELLPTLTSVTMNQKASSSRRLNKRFQPLGAK
jgi:hypothetical protein